MQNMIDICGTPIATSMIKQYRLLKVSYLFRPVFREQKKGINIFQQKYIADKAEPYGMIVDQESHRLALENAKSTNVFEALFQDVSFGLVGKIAEKCNWNNTKLKTLSIMGLSGSIFQKRFDEIPAKLIKADGQVIDFYKDDQVHKELLDSRPINSEIRIIDSLWIRLNNGEHYTFFDTGLQITSVVTEYEKIKRALEATEQIGKDKELPPEKKVKPALPSIQLPQLNMPKVKLPDIKIPTINISINPTKKDE